MRYVLEETYCTHVQHKYTRVKNTMTNFQKEIQTKLTKGLLDMIILQYLDAQPMHGYQVITKIRKSFGVYFGPSTIYPLLNALEKKGYVKSEWNMNTERPRKVYRLTNEGQTVLNFTEGSLNLICKAMSNDNKVSLEAANVHSIRSNSRKHGIIQA
jgi:PadR family transcriptional regulator PadR